MAMIFLKGSESFKNYVTSVLCTLGSLGSQERINFQWNPLLHVRNFVLVVVGVETWAKHLPKGRFTPNKNKKFPNGTKNILKQNVLQIEQELLHKEQELKVTSSMHLWLMCILSPFTSMYVCGLLELSMVLNGLLMVFKGHFLFFCGLLWPNIVSSRGHRSKFIGLNARDIHWKVLLHYSFQWMTIIFFFRST